MRERGRLAAVPGGALLRSAWQWASRRLAVHGRVRVGSNFRLGTGTVIRSFHGLEIGNGVSIGRNCTIEVSGAIGDKTVLAANVGLVGRADHAIDEVGTAVIDSTWVGDRSDPLSSDMLYIGRDVWVGYGAVILSGVSIGDGAVVAAGAVVTRDIPAFSIAAGTPARVVGSRFDESDARRHLDLLGFGGSGAGDFERLEK